MADGVRIGLVVTAQASLYETLDEFVRVERLGLSSAWFTQTPEGLDAPMVLALAATRTSGLRLGTSVIPTVPRHPVVTAGVVRTLGAVAPRRIVLGVSNGHRRWIENDYGMRFAQPAQHAREWVSTLRRLLRGDSLQAHDNAFGINAPRRAPAPEVPIVLGATGPHLLEVAGEIADGALTWMTDVAYLSEIVLPAVRRGADRAARETPPLTCGVMICVTGDPQRARSHLLPRLAPLAAFDSYRAVLDHAAPERRSPVDMALVGSKADVVNGMSRLATTGVNELVAVILEDADDPVASRQGAEEALAILSRL